MSIGVRPPERPSRNTIPSTDAFIKRLMTLAYPIATKAEYSPTHCDVGPSELTPLSSIAANPLVAQVGAPRARLVDLGALIPGLEVLDDRVDPCPRGLDPVTP